VTTAGPQVYPPSREALRRDLAVALAEAGERIEMTATPVLAGFAELYERHYEAVFRGPVEGAVGGYFGDR